LRRTSSNRRSYWSWFAGALIAFDNLLTGCRIDAVVGERCSHHGSNNSFILEAPKRYS
jgi:hypothetical protein